MTVRPAPSRHRAAHAPTTTGPSLRTTILATTAAFGAVATGTFTALTPSGSTGAATPAAAAEESPTELIPAAAAMAAHFTTAPVADTSSLLPVQGAAAALLPVSTRPPADEGGAQAQDEHLARLDKAATLAAKLAQQHAKEAEQTRVRDLVAHGGVDAWVAEALNVLDLPQSYGPAVKRIIMKESGGNPLAVNLWDSNARRGTPSRGLMQTIPSTYRHYVHPQLADRPITDPVANITAGVRYMIDNYGVGTLAAGGRSNTLGGYVGY